MVSSQLTYQSSCTRKSIVYRDDKEGASLRDGEAFFPFEDSIEMGSLTIGRQLMVLSVHLKSTVDSF